MARGDQAKSGVIAKLQEAFGNDYIGEISKKFYVWANEGGEKIQIAITLTCPKTPVEVESKPESNVLDFSTPVQKASVEITEEEKKNLAELMARLGL